MNPQLQEEISNLEEGVFDEGGLHGWALDLVQQIINQPGEEFTDQQCLWMIAHVVNAWSELADRGLS